MTRGLSAYSTQGDTNSEDEHPRVSQSLKMGGHYYGVGKA